MHHPDVTAALVRDRQRHLRAEAGGLRRVREIRRRAVRPPGGAVVLASLMYVVSRALGRSAVPPLR
jgi:hypothetical protein